MKKSELIKLLEQAPDGAEIMVMHGDDTLGYYYWS
jgi:hypothetical protein